MPRLILIAKGFLGAALALCACAALYSYRSSYAHVDPTIEFIQVPEAGPGNPDKVDPIEGRVTGAPPSTRLVLYALSGVWWVQPFPERPFTEIQPDSKWKSITHPGVLYAALLVDTQYRPPLTIESLPKKGGHVLAIANVKGRPSPVPPATLDFSGYQWEIRQTPRGAGRSGNLYDRANAWIDAKGWLHLRVSKEVDHWANAEVRLSRSLGYGSYRFVVQDISHLEPVAVFAISTWDELGPSREMDIEISRWGIPEDKNAQYVVQPWDVPANTMRFTAPPGTLTYSMTWEPGRVTFKTARAASDMDKSDVSEHAFTSGIPVAGNERLRINLYVYYFSQSQLQHDFEVVLEKFDYLP